LYKSLLLGFPPPWSVEETAACFIVRDHGGQKLAYAYCEEEPGRLSPTRRPTCISSGRGDHMIGRPWLVARPIRMASISNSRYIGTMPTLDFFTYKPIAMFH